MKYIIILLILLITLISYFISEKRKKIYYVFIALIFGILSYSIYPNIHLDLSRMYLEMESLKNLPVSELFSNDLFLTTPTYALYIYIIGKIGIMRLFQASTTFVIYLLMLLMIRDVSKRRQLSKKTELVLILSFFLINNFVTAVSGVRFYFATTIFIYVLYKELIYKIKFRKCLVIYILCCLFHNSVAILLFFRLLLPLYEKSKYIKILINAILLLWTFFKNGIILILREFPNIPFLYTTGYKLSAYDSEQANLVANVELYTFVALTLLIIITIIFIFYKIIEKNKRQNNQNNRQDGSLDNYITMIVFFLFGSIAEYHIFIRFTEVLFKLMLTKIGLVFDSKGIISYNSKLVCFLMLSIESILYLIFYIIGQFNLIYIGW